jgi:cysteine desulfurase
LTIISIGSIADIYRNITLCHDADVFERFYKKNTTMGKSQCIYLDHASATPVLPEVMSAMMPYFTESFGNPGSIHSEGMIAKSAVLHARTTVARMLSVQPESVTFTSGGTESNNLGIIGVVEAKHQSGLPYNQIEIITTKIEHPATSKTFEYLGSMGVVVNYAPVDGGGEIILSELASLFTPRTLLVSVAYVNSEIGVIQDIGAISRVLAKFSKQHECSIYLHVDAAQAPLWLPCELSRLGCDLLSLDAGKFGGQKGVGALVHLKRVPIVNIAYGGGQERGLRSGTESVASIVGFATAFEVAQKNWSANSEQVAKLQAYFFNQLAEKIPTATINGVIGESRVANNINISIPGIDSEFAVVTLDVAGIACSTKSACSSAGGGASIVVETITGDTARASTTLRFSFGVQTTEAEINQALEVLSEHIHKIVR